MKYCKKIQLNTYITILELKTNTPPYTFTCLGSCDDDREKISDNGIWSINTLVTINKGDFPFKQQTDYFNKKYIMNDKDILINGYDDSCEEGTIGKGTCKVYIVPDNT